MTRRVLLVEISKVTGLFFGAVGLMAGCGDSGVESGSQVKVSAERQAQITAEQKATQDFYASKKKK